MVQSDDPISDVIDKMSQAWGSDCILPDAHSEGRTNLLSPALLPARRRQSSFALVMIGDRLVGIFTERDLVKLAAASIQLESAKISDVMTSDVVTLQAEANQDIFTARAYFLKHKIRHLPVLDSQHKLLGVITSESIRQALQPLYFMTLKARGRCDDSGSITCANHNVGAEFGSDDGRAPGELRGDYSGSSAAAN